MVVISDGKVFVRSLVVFSDKSNFADAGQRRGEVDAVKENFHSQKARSPREICASSYTFCSNPSTSATSASNRRTLPRGPGGPGHTGSPQRPGARAGPGRRPIEAESSPVRPHLGSCSTHFKNSPLNQSHTPNEKPGIRSMPSADLMRYSTKMPTNAEKVMNTASVVAIARR